MDSAICIRSFFWIISRITHGFGGWLLAAGRIDEATAFFGLTIEGARSGLETVVTANLSFLVFTFGSLLVAIQAAGGQYTPRIIATTILQDNPIQFTVGYFVFTLLFSQRARVKMGDTTVHQFNTFIAGVLGPCTEIVFLYLIGHAERFLRPVSIVYRLGQSGIAVIHSVNPEEAMPPKTGEKPALRIPADLTVTNADRSGIILAFDPKGLVAQAKRANGFIEVQPEVGNFVAVGEPLFEPYGGAAEIDDRTLN